MIEAGEFFFGLGWAFQDATPEQATFWQYAGIAGMAVGGVLVLAGLIRIARREPPESGGGPVRCPRCGGDNSEGSTYCVDCGASLD